MTKELTKEDRTVLNNEKRIGYVFAGLIICFGGLFNIFYFIMYKVELNYIIIGSIDLAILFLAYLVCIRLNLKANLDLKDNKKEIYKRVVENKLEYISFEVGSGARGRKMREVMIYYIFAKGNKFDVGKDFFYNINIGAEFYVHYAKHSETILGFSKEEL